MKIATHYTTITDFGEIGIGSTDPMTFDDAVDAYAANMAEGLPSAVWRIEPPKNGRAGMAIDVTDDAAARVRIRLRSRPGYLAMPEWAAE